MTERQAAVFANKVYAAFHANQITAQEAIKYLDKVRNRFSTNQFYKYIDFVDAVRNGSYKQ